MANWPCEHCSRQLAADDALRGRPIRCPFCRLIQIVPPAAADPPPTPPEDDRRHSPMAVEQVPERIVINGEDLDEDVPAPAAIGGGVYDPRQRGRAQQAWSRRERLTADDDAVGRTCPYCLTKLAAGNEAVVCPACNTIHHSECWSENEGCCMFGCRLAPFRSSLSPAHRYAGPAPPMRGQMSGVCGSCGSVVRPGDVYCTYCGQPVGGPGRSAGRSRGGTMNRMAGESLMFGLLSLVCGPLFLLFSPLAIYHGARAIRELEQDPAATGRPAATSGIFLGVISAILWLIVAVTLLPRMATR